MIYEFLLNDGNYKWSHTNVLSVSPSIIPGHCNNCKHDPELGEEGMDCGGPCPPCEHAQDKVIINTPTNNLPANVNAIEEIIAGNAAVKVLSGQNVNFNTLGTIRLLPGFEAQAGGNFNAQVKGNILGVTADCNKFCNPTIYGKYVRWLDYFTVDVANVNKITFDFYNNNHWGGTRLVYSQTIMNQEGRVESWNLVTGDIKGDLKPDGYWYMYKYWIQFYPCQGGGVRNYYGDFLIYNPKNKTLSIDSESEESENPAPILSPNFNSIPFQDENGTPTFSIIPNPNPGIFQLESNFPHTDIANLKIVNMLGAPVYETQNVTSNTIQLSAAASGQHFVVVVLKDGSVLTQKMMIQK
jgi:hypothetical protein